MKDFKDLELGDVLYHKKLDNTYFISEKGLDYIKLENALDEPKWLVSERYYNKGEFVLVNLD